MHDFPLKDGIQINEIVKDLKRAIQYIGVAPERTSPLEPSRPSQPNEPFSGTHRHLILSNTIDAGDQALHQLQQKFTISCIDRRWDEAAGQHELRFLAEPKPAFQSVHRAPEVVNNGKRTPYGLACFLRSKISGDLKLAAEIDRTKPDFQIIITDGRGMRAQMWMHENTGNWQIEDDVDCHALAERLGGSFFTKPA